jgi:uracil-DNA glycosylase
MVLTSLHPKWKALLSAEWEKPYFKKIEQFLENEEALQQAVYPPKPLIFNAFNTTPFDQIKVVLLGQDPYHGLGQANGLCFSVPNGMKLPPSLKNIYKELKNNYPEYPIPLNGDLSKWAEQGVLLLNSILTVAANSPASHAKIGWEQLTNAVLQRISQEQDHVVFILWGAYAKSKLPFIDATNHLVLQSGHPSFADSHKQFFGNNHFKKCNAYLVLHGKKSIDWRM